MDRPRHTSLAGPLTAVITAALCGGGGAAFERALFLPVDAPRAGLAANPAALALGGDSWCAQLGHDRPFGLRPLAGHHLALRSPALSGLHFGLAAGARGPARHRETGVGLGVGLSLGTLSLGAGATWLRFDQSGDAARAAALPVAGVALRFGSSWTLEAWRRAGAASLGPAQWGARLTAADGGGFATAATAGRGRQRGVSPGRVALVVGSRPEPGAELRAGATSGPRQFRAGATLYRGRRFAAVDLFSHPQLGLTSAWLVGRACD